MGVLSAGPPRRASAASRRGPDIPISDRDRVFAEQFSNTVTVTDPASSNVLG